MTNRDPIVTNAHMDTNAADDPNNDEVTGNIAAIEPVENSGCAFVVGFVTIAYIASAATLVALKKKD